MHRVRREAKHSAEARVLTGEREAEESVGTFVRERTRRAERLALRRRHAPSSAELVLDDARLACDARFLAEGLAALAVRADRMDLDVVREELEVTRPGDAFGLALTTRLGIALATGRRTSARGRAAIDARSSDARESREARIRRTRTARATA